jgi:superfamily II DNA/RNA helicase
VLDEADKLFEMGFVEQVRVVTHICFLPSKAKECLQFHCRNV